MKKKKKIYYIVTINNDGDVYFDSFESKRHMKDVISIKNKVENIKLCKRVCKEYVLDIIQKEWERKNG